MKTNNTIENQQHYSKPATLFKTNNTIQNQQHYSEFTKAQKTHTKHVHTIRCVQTQVPGLQQGICGSDWQELQGQV